MYLTVFIYVYITNIYCTQKGIENIMLGAKWNWAEYNSNICKICRLSSKDLRIFLGRQCTVNVSVHFTYTQLIEESQWNSFGGKVAEGAGLEWK